MTQVDVVLWSAVVPLFLAALWLSRPRPRAWSPAALFQTCRGLLTGTAGSDTAVHPRACIGVACTDGALRRWAHRDSSPDGDAGVAAALERRGATVLYWGSRALTLPAARGWPGIDTGATPTPELEAVLETLLAVPATRFVLVVSEGAERFFPFFAEVPGLRDRTRAVVFVGADLAASAEWLATSFTHDHLDLELDRRLPWLTLRTGPGQVLRVPAEDPTGRNSIEVVDLGEVDLEAREVGPALLLVLAALG